MPEALRCSSVTRQGEPCKGYAVEDETTCVAHTPRIAELARSKGVERSREVRKERVEQREQASEAAKLSLTERIRYQAAANQTELVDSLVKAAIADGNGAAMRELLNRVDGKVTDSLSLNAGNPFEMDEASLHRWLAESPTVDEPSVSTDEPPNGHTDRPNSSSKDPS